MKVKLSIEEALAFHDRWNAALSDGSLAFCIMPNGKRFSDCSKSYLKGIVKAMSVAAEQVAVQELIKFAEAKGISNAAKMRPPELLAALEPFSKVAPQFV